MLQVWLPLSIVEAEVHSPQELRTLAWNCRSLARHGQPVSLKSSLLKMARTFEQEAAQRERLRNPIGGGRY